MQKTMHTASAYGDRCIRVNESACWTQDGSNLNKQPTCSFRTNTHTVQDTNYLWLRFHQRLDSSLSRGFLLSCANSESIRIEEKYQGVREGTNYLTIEAPPVRVRLFEDKWARNSTLRQRLVASTLTKRSIINASLSKLTSGDIHEWDSAAGAPCTDEHSLRTAQGLPSPGHSEYTYNRK